MLYAGAYRYRRGERQAVHREFNLSTHCACVQTNARQAGKATQEKRKCPAAHESEQVVGLMRLRLAGRRLHKEVHFKNESSQRLFGDGAETNLMHNDDGA